jgi:hypothetical protein
MYNPALDPGKAYKFDKTERKVDTDDLPGPGYYYVPCTFADVPRYNLPIQNEDFKWV